MFNWVKCIAKGHRSSGSMPYLRRLYALCNTTRLCLSCYVCSSTGVAGLGARLKFWPQQNIFFGPELTRPLQQPHLKQWQIFENDVLAHWFKARVNCEVTVGWKDWVRHTVANLVYIVFHSASSGVFEAWWWWCCGQKWCQMPIMN